LLLPPWLDEAGYPSASSDGSAVSQGGYPVELRALAAHPRSNRQPDWALTTSAWNAERTPANRRRKGLPWANGRASSRGCPAAAGQG